MAILGIGIDIEDVGRFRARPYDRNKTFYQKIFTKQEIAYCQKSADPAERFTARFAAKEACVKALGGILRKHIRTVRDVEVRMKRGRPYVELPGVRAYVSLSHTRHQAIASVLIERS